MKKYYFIGAIVALIYSGFEAYTQYITHVRLERGGEVVEVGVESYSKSWEQLYYVKYCFRAEDGTLIEEHKRTSEPREYYMGLRVIYDPTDPQTYQELPDFERYSVGLAVFLHLSLFGVTTFLFGGFLALGVKIIQAIRDDDNMSFGQRLMKHLHRCNRHMNHYPHPQR